MTKIEELEQGIDEAVEKFRFDINKFKAELEKIKALVELKESKKEGKWRPKDGVKYWFKCDSGNIDYCINYDTEIDNWRINNIPIFPTKEECEKYWDFMDTVKEKSYEFSKEEWENTSVKKWLIRYNIGYGELETGSNTIYKVLGRIYFKTEEDAQYIIDNFKEELEKYWL